MKYIFIDTNLYLYCALLSKGKHEPDTLKKIKTLLENNLVTLLIPEVVEIEFHRKVNEQYDNLKKDVSSFKNIFNKKFPSLLREEKQDMLNNIDNLIDKRNISLKRVKDLFDEIISLDNSIIIKLSSNIFTNAYKRTLKGLKPYNGKHIINQDCMIVESLISYCSKNSISELVICSDNINDFAIYDNNDDIHKLHKDIKTDFKYDTKLYINLTKMLNNEFDEEIDQQEIEEIHLEQIKKRWEDILKEVKKNDLTTQALLIEGYPNEIENRELHIIYDKEKIFHKKNLNKKIELVNKAIKSVTGMDIKAKGVLINSTK